MTPSERPRLHPSLVSGITAAIGRIFFHGEHAETVVAQTLRSDTRWGSRDRAFVASSVYDLIRWWRLLWAMKGEAPRNEAQAILALLCLNEKLNSFSLPESFPFAHHSPEQVLALKQSFQSQPAIYHSLPDWLEERGLAECGAEWEPLRPALNEQAPVFLRVNTLRTTRAALLIRLQKAGFEVQAVDSLPHGIQAGRKGNLTGTEAWREGEFEIQDAGSQQIAAFLDVQPGMTVLDACAGAGGKTLHLACLMQNQGRLFAADAEARRLAELEKRAQRAGIRHLQVKAIPDSLKAPDHFPPLDRLLLDVPCSGTGTLRRKPDLKWKLSPAFVEECIRTQAMILESYSGLVKPGGKMVYATCSVFPSENEKQVGQFLAAHPRFRLQKSQTLSPAKGATDGYFMALLEKD